jgi:hypothetical protein
MRKGPTATIIWQKIFPQLASLNPNKVSKALPAVISQRRHASDQGKDLGSEDNEGTESEHEDAVAVRIAIRVKDALYIYHRAMLSPRSQIVYEAFGRAFAVNPGVSRLGPPWAPLTSCLDGGLRGWREMALRHVDCLLP